MVITAIFAAYVLYAVAVLLWSGSERARPPLEHRAISAEALRERRFASEPIVIELRTDGVRERPAAPAGALVMSDAELLRMVRWVPPGAVLIFRGASGGRRLDPVVERDLQDMGIGSVYWVSGNAEGARRAG